MAEKKFTKSDHKEMTDKHKSMELRAVAGGLVGEAAGSALSKAKQAYKSTKTSKEGAKIVKHNSHSAKEALRRAKESYKNSKGSSRSRVIGALAGGTAWASAAGAANRKSDIKHINSKMEKKAEESKVTRAAVGAGIGYAASKAINSAKISKATGGGAKDLISNSRIARGSGKAALAGGIIGAVTAGAKKRLEKKAMANKYLEKIAEKKDSHKLGMAAGATALTAAGMGAVEAAEIGAKKTVRNDYRRRLQNMRKRGPIKNNAENRSFMKTISKGSRDKVQKTAIGRRKAVLVGGLAAGAALGKKISEKLKNKDN